MITAQAPTSPSPGWGTRILQFPLTRIVLAILFLAVPVSLTLILIKAALPKPMRTLWPPLLATAICIGSYCLYVRLIEKRPVSELSRPGALRELGSGLLIGASLLAATMGILAALGVYQVTGSDRWTVVIVPLAGLILVGFLEEILFRGILFRIVEESLGSWISLALSAVLFALAHVANADVTLFAMGVTAVAGVFFSAAYMVTRRLWLCTGIHIAWNFAQGEIFSVTVSGQQSKGLLQGKLVGAEWLTGGAYGAEASVITLVVISAAGLYFLVKAKRGGHFVLAFWQRRAIGVLNAPEPPRSG
jgi:membrane protease YdiL (CAAX protease family)